MPVAAKESNDAQSDDCTLPEAVQIVLTVWHIEEGPYLGGHLEK